MKILKYIFLLLFFLKLVQVKANDEYQTKFLNGKELLKMGKFTAAMETFLPLTKEEKGNHFVQYSHYFYGLSAMKANRLQEGYLMLLQLTQRYPDWQNIDEAYYLLTNIAFEQKKYRYGLNFLKGHCAAMQEDVDLMKNNYFSKVNIDTLKAIQKSYSTDASLAKLLAQRLSVGVIQEKDKMLLQYLVQEFKLDPEKLKPAKKNTAKKDSYNVAVLFPFMYNEVKAENPVRPNQYAFDMYEGIRMAINSLRSNNVNINLYAYDTEKDDSKVINLLKQPELKSMDLLIGPIIPSHNNLVNEFAAANQIMVINPLSVNSKLIENNEFVLLFQPTLEVQAKRVSEFVEINLPPAADKNNVIIFFSDNQKDSILATIYRDIIKSKNYNVINFESVNKDKTKKIKDVLADSLKLTKTSHVFVSSTDRVVAANVVSGMDISRQAVPIITKSDWLEFPLLTFEQLQRRQTHFIYPDFIDYDNPSVKRFRNDYIERMNIFPTSYSYQGYDLMNFFGQQLYNNGANFKEGLASSGFIKGNLLQGFDYTNSSTNQFVPLVKFEDHQLKLVNNLDSLKEQK